MQSHEIADPFTHCLLASLREAALSLGESGDDGALRVADRLGIGRFVRFRTRKSPGDGAPDGVRIMVDLEQGFVREAAEELSAQLTMRGVRHFFVKGMAIAGRVYESGEREMADIDLHVAPVARDAVLDTLNELGYHIPPDDEQSGPARLRSGLFAGRYTGSSPLEYVGVDLAWGLDPVDRLLPRPDFPVPELVWEGLDTSGPMPIPADAHHVVLIIHHLVHHDMLHLRGLVDLALLWPRVSQASCLEIESLATQLGVWRVTRSLAESLRTGFDVTLPSPGPAPDDWRGRRARRMLEPVRWIVWAASAKDTEFVEINMRRIRRRVLLLDDLLDLPNLVADALIPPAEYLAWRWPETRSMLEARLIHLFRVAGKLF